MIILCGMLAACTPAEKGDSASSVDQARQTRGSPPHTPLRPASERPLAANGQWSLDDANLTFSDAEQDRPLLVMTCHRGRLSVRLPGVDMIGSEERLSFGGGGDVLTLIVSGEDASGVVGAGTAPDPARLLALLTAGPGASYGASAVGPLAPVADAEARSFVARCGQASGT